MYSVMGMSREQAKCGWPRPAAAAAFWTACHTRPSPANSQESRNRSRPVVKRAHHRVAASHHLLLGGRPPHHHILRLLPHLFLHALLHLLLNGDRLPTATVLCPRAYRNSKLTSAAFACLARSIAASSCCKKLFSPRFHLYHNKAENMRFMKPLLHQLTGVGGVRLS